MQRAMLVQVIFSLRLSVSALNFLRCCICGFPVSCFDGLFTQKTS